MPLPIQRPSLTTTLDQRYAKQHAGEAFDVKAVLGASGAEPIAGKTIDATSQNGVTFQSPNGFLVRPKAQVSQFLAVQSGDTKGLSTYVNGLDTKKYRP